MKVSERKKKYRRKKIMRLLTVLSALMVLLVVLVKQEVSDNVIGKEINIQSKENDAAVSTDKNTETSDDIINVIQQDRWNYKSKYEYDIPRIRNNVQIQKKLSEFAEKYPEFRDINANIASYPEALLAALCNNPDMIDFVKGYLASDKSAAEEKEWSEVSDNEIPLFLQWDSRWGYVPYGDDNIALSGCAPTCLAMVIVGITGNDEITPDIVAEYASENDYYIKGTGTTWNIMTEGCRHFGIHGKIIGLSEKRVFSELVKGHPIICSMREGDFTTYGHFIVLAGIKDGKIIVNDPNSKVRSSRLWDYETLQSQIKNLWAFTS